MQKTLRGVDPLTLDDLVISEHEAEHEDLGKKKLFQQSSLLPAAWHGVIDGFEFPLRDLVSAKLYEVAKCDSLDRHTIDFYTVSTNKALWTSLAAEEQGLIAQAMKTAMDWQWKAQPVVIANAEAKLRGMIQVHDITPANPSCSWTPRGRSTNRLKVPSARTSST